MKKILKAMFKFILGIFLFSGLYIAAVFLLPKITFNAEPADSKDINIYVITNGVHTDIVVPVKTTLIDWSKEIKYSDAEAVDSTYTYLGMGWGDKGFYLETPTWAELKPSVAFKAAFGINSTAIHATYYKPKQLIVNDTCKQARLSHLQYSRLVNFIKNTFKYDSNGHVINIQTDANYGKTDAFYEAKGRYSMFNTCNGWTNKALKVSGQKYCLWTALDFGVIQLFK